MQARNILFLILISLFLFSCEKDPLFEKEDESVTISTYITNVGYKSADIYSQISSNVGIAKVSLEISKDQDMSRSDVFGMSVTTNYPKDAYFSNSSDVYHVALSDLVDDVTYYIQIKAETSVGSIIEKKGIKFTTLSLSSTAVTTLPATNISYTNATLNGKVVSSKDVHVNETGFYYADNSNMDNAISIKGNSLSGAFYAKISNITSNRTYYYQAYAKIDGVNYEGKILKLSTNQYILPTVITDVFENLTFNSVDCSLTILESGNTAITEWGILYGKESNLNISNAKKVSYTYSPSLQTQLFITINNLEGNTVYKYRAFATNTAGTAYGDEYFFWTDKSPDIQVETLEASAIGYTNAHANYTIHTYGQNVIEYGVIYDVYTYRSTLEYEDEHPIKKVSVTNWIGQEKEINSYFSLSQLTSGTEYQYRAYVKYIERWGDISIVYSNYEYFETEYR